MKKSILFLCHILLVALSAKAQQIQILQQDKPTSIRGLSVVDDNVAWISGSRGYIAITANGGKTWNWSQVKGHEKAEFRDIEAFSDKEAVIIASGSPAVILKTTDGGANWKETFQNPDSAYFLDAMDFSDPKHGYVLGDPINNKFLLLETKDGGETWTNNTQKAPPAAKNEAAFAASGTCLRFDGKRITIVTGGSIARIITSTNGGRGWFFMSVAVAQGESAKGAFSFAQYKNHVVVVGGDYSKDKLTDSVACYSDNLKKWQLLSIQPLGFQSCVEHIDGLVYLATGTPGSNITTDGGKTWKQIDTTSFNVCRKAKRGKLVLLAGNGGKIALLKM